MLNLKHIFTAKSLKAIVVFWLTAAGLIFIFRALTSEIDWHWQPFVSYLASIQFGSFLSVLLLILFLTLFPQLFRHKYIWVFGFVSSIVLLAIFHLTGLSRLWLFNVTAFMMGYLVTPLLFAENSSGKASKANKVKDSASK